MAPLRELLASTGCLSGLLPRGRCGAKRIGEAVEFSVGRLMLAGRRGANGDSG